MNVLVCGTRGAKKPELFMNIMQGLPSDAMIVHGACPDSADEWAQEWADLCGRKTMRFPATSGNYLKRNIEMVAVANMVIAFWDNFSYGTAHTIAHAHKKGIPVDIIEVHR